MPKNVVRIEVKKQLLSNLKIQLTLWKARMTG